MEQCINAGCLTHTGFPIPSISWSKLRAPLPWRHQLVNGSLVLPNVGRQDSGEYICNATNPLGTSEVTVSLDVESESGVMNVSISKTLLIIKLLTLSEDTLLY